MSFCRAFAKDAMVLREAVRNGHLSAQLAPVGPRGPNVSSFGLLVLQMAILFQLAFAGRVKIIDRKKNLATASSINCVKCPRLNSPEVKLKGGEYVALEMINVPTSAALTKLFAPRVQSRHIAVICCGLR